jgi:hypothetical protein
LTALSGHELRYEVKFVAYAIHRPYLERWLLDNAAGFVSPYPSRQVNNVYFDTWDYRAYSENLAGISQRSKVRYRWYGENEGPMPGKLEVKHRRNQVGWKERFDVGMRVWTPHWSWHDVRFSLVEQVPRSARRWLDCNPQPVFINRYEREYFVSGDGLIRATIDTNQRAYDQRWHAMPNLSNPAVMQDTVVLEFKFAPEHRQIAVGMLADIPVRLGRHSKYMNAVRSIAMV